MARPISSMGWRTLVIGRVHVAGDRRVVVADQRHVVGYAAARLAQDLAGAGGHDVGLGEDRVEVGAAGQQFRHRPAAALLGEVAGDDQALVDLAARVLQGVAVAHDAPLGAVDVQAAGDGARFAARPRSIRCSTAERPPP